MKKDIAEKRSCRKAHQINQQTVKPLCLQGQKQHARKRYGADRKNRDECVELVRHTILGLTT